MFVSPFQVDIDNRDLVINYNYLKNLNYFKASNELDLKIKNYRFFGKLVAGSGFEPLTARL